MKKNNFLSVLIAAICCLLIIASCANSNQKSAEDAPAVTVLSEDIV